MSTEELIGSRILSNLFLIFAVVVAGSGQALPYVHADNYPGHPRVIIISDIGNEPDDQMSLVRLLLYSNELDIEALIAATSTWQKAAVHPETMHLEFTSDNFPGYQDNHPDFQFDVKRDPFGLSLAGNTLTVTDLLHYLAGAQKCVLVCFSVHCGDHPPSEPPRRISVSAQTTVRLKPDFSVESRSRLLGVTPLDECKLGPFGLFNATGLIVNRASDLVSNKLGTVDDRIVSAGANIRPAAQRAWNEANTPIMVADGVWLLLNPSTIRGLNFNGSGLTLTTSIGVSAKPVIVVGAKPSSAIPPLPDLDPTASPATGFHVALDSMIPFTALADAAKPAVVGQRIFMPKPFPSGYYVDVTGLEAYGSSGKCVVGISFRGVFNGEVFLIGTPSLNTDTGLVTVDDLDYTLETKTLLAKLANTLFADDVRRTLRQHAQISVRDKLDALRSNLDKALNRSIGGVTLKGSLTVLRAVPPSPSKDTLTVRAIADGTLSLSV